MFTVTPPGALLINVTVPTSEPDLDDLAARTKAHGPVDLCTLSQAEARALMVMAPGAVLDPPTALDERSLVDRGLAARQGDALVARGNALVPVRLQPPRPGTVLSRVSVSSCPEGLGAEDELWTNVLHSEPYGIVCVLSCAPADRDRITVHLDTPERFVADLIDTWRPPGTGALRMIEVLADWTLSGRRMRRKWKPRAWLLNPDQTLTRHPRRKPAFTSAAPMDREAFVQEVAGFLGGR